MHVPKARRDLFMLPLSTKRIPVFFVEEPLSDPARSTRVKFPRVILLSMPVTLSFSSSCTWRMAWDREDTSFI